MMASEVMRRFKAWQKGIPQGPLALYMIPTQRCNLTCVFCRYKHWDRFSNTTELSDEEWLRIFRECAERGVQWFDVMGGEPLLRKELVLKLAGEARAYGVKGSIVTNGMLFTRDVARELIEQEWNLVQVSVDAPDEKVHNGLRKHPQSFAAAVKCLQALDAERRARDTDDTAVQLNMVLTTATLDSLPRMVEFAKLHGCDRIKFIPMVLSEDESTHLRIPGEMNQELLKEMQMCKEVAHDSGIETNIDDLQNSLRQGPLDSHSVMGSGSYTQTGYPACYAPWWTLTVFPEGGVTCCLSSDDRLANLSSQTVMDVWTGPAFEQVRNTLLSSTIQACENCCYVKASENLVIRRLEA